VFLRLIVVSRVQMNLALDLKDHRGLKNYLPRVPFANGCLLNSLVRVGQLPDGRKSIPQQERVGALVKQIKVAHLNCAVNKLVWNLHRALTVLRPLRCAFG
jgi:hypothetical protein